MSVILEQKYMSPMTYGKLFNYDVIQGWSSQTYLSLSIELSEILSTG